MSDSPDPSLYHFTGSNGETVSFPPDATIEDLVRAGFCDVRLAKPDEPLREDWYRHSGETPVKP